VVAIGPLPPVVDAWCSVLEDLDARGVDEEEMMDVRDGDVPGAAVGVFGGVV
jgi:hypothetical protein